MHEPKPPRTLEDIDADLRVEYIELGYARRSGGAALVQAWRRIDALLDERLTVMPVLPALPGLRAAAPRPLDGGVVPA